MINSNSGSHLCWSILKPLREGKPEIAEEYALELPKFRNLTFLNPTREILITAAKLRGNTNFKLIDALHLATAIQKKCEIFITNDTTMKCDILDLDIWLMSEI